MSTRTAKVNHRDPVVVHDLMKTCRNLWKTKGVPAPSLRDKVLKMWHESLPDDAELAALFLCTRFLVEVPRSQLPYNVFEFRRWASLPNTLTGDHLASLLGPLVVHSWDAEGIMGTNGVAIHVQFPELRFLGMAEIGTYAREIRLRHLQEQLVAKALDDPLCTRAILLDAPPARPRADGKVPLPSGWVTRWLRQIQQPMVLPPGETFGRQQREVFQSVSPLHGEATQALCTEIAYLNGITCSVFRREWTDPASCLLYMSDLPPDCFQRDRIPIEVRCVVYVRSLDVFFVHCTGTDTPARDRIFKRPGDALEMLIWMHPELDPREVFQSTVLFASILNLPDEQCPALWYARARYAETHSMSTQLGLTLGPEASGFPATEPDKLPPDVLVEMRDREEEARLHRDGVADEEYAEEWERRQ